MKQSGILITIVVALGCVSARADDWPAFRGSVGNGISTESSFPVKWDTTTNVKWKTALPEPGNGSPIISRGRVFVTGASKNGKERRLYCFDRRDGKQVWVRTVPFDKVETTHKTNPYDSSTPVADGKRVVVWHGSAGLYCYDFDGQELWSVDPGDVIHIWGYGASPIIHGGTVFLNHGPGPQSFMVAVDLQTGKVIWKTDEPGGSSSTKPRMVGSWSTPIIAHVGGADQLICTMPTRVVAYDLDSGEILWTCGGIPSKRGDLIYTSPLVSGDMGVALTGFKGPALAFRLDGSGDVTDTNRLWRIEEGQPQRIGSGVISDGYIYIGNAGPGTFQCIEVATGRVNWEARTSASNHWGSTILAGGRLYATNQDGTTDVFHANPDRFDLIASNRLNESTNSTPAFSDGEIFLRTVEHLYCIADGGRKRASNSSSK